VDGPVVINAMIYTEYRDDVNHLDRIRRTDVTPNLTYLVIAPEDPAGWLHHRKFTCSRIETIGAPGS
jgi:hypothetical protein